MSSNEEMAGERAGGEVRNPVVEVQQDPAHPDPEHLDPEHLDPLLKAVLDDFQLSVHAWSNAEYSRSRTLPATAPNHITWRLAAGWALGCVLVAGGVSGRVFERHHRQEAARIAAAKQAEQKRLLAEVRAREMDDLLAKVESDVAREVPSAMEPLTRLMAEDETQ